MFIRSVISSIIAINLATAAQAKESVINFQHRNNAVQQSGMYRDKPWIYLPPYGENKLHNQAGASLGDSVRMLKRLKENSRKSLSTETDLKLPAEIGRIEAPPGHTIDEWLEDPISYKSYRSTLKNKKNEPYPYGIFQILVDKAGTGHLQAYCTRSTLFKRSEKQYKDKILLKQSPDGVLLNWRVRTSFLKRDVGWTKLDFKEAVELWGKPREHLTFIGVFYTFDAHSQGKEEDIYHLDLQFEDNALSAYRVRGLGIAKPKWITKDTRL